MQTNGTSLLAVNRCSLARVRMAAQDRRSAPALLYSTAVRLSARNWSVVPLMGYWPFPYQISSGTAQTDQDLPRSAWPSIDRG
jgi:hypothetical protein